MGSFYTNVTLRHAAVDEVVRALEAAGRSAFVSPAVNGCCVVFDAAAEEQDAAELERLVKPLSKRLRCAALAVLIHDDDLLYYALFESGRMTDEYNSRPDYFESGTRPPEGGAARALAAAFDAHARAGDVERILHRGEYAVETERHAELVEALGIPEAAVGTGFNYISEGELPPGLTAADLATVGDARIETDADAPPAFDLSPEETAALQARLSARVRPSPELAAVIGAGPFPYQMVVMKVIGYVVRNGLGTPGRNEIVPDALLAEVVGKAPIPYAKLALLLDRHLTAEAP